MKTEKETADLAAPSLQRLLRERAARLNGRGAPDSEDLVQDTLERALRNLHRFEPGTNLQGWLSTIMQRLMIDRHRRARTFRWVPLPDLAAAEPDGEDRESFVLSTVSRLDELLARLPPLFRSVLELHGRGGLRYREIAERLSIPVATVGTRIMRARQLMRKLSGPGHWSRPVQRRTRRPYRRSSRPAAALT